MPLFRSLAFGSALALIDIVALPIVKRIHATGLPVYWMAIPIALYALDPIIFFASLSTQSMVVMNILWDLLSDIGITIIGIAFFKEHITAKKGAGIVAAIIAMYLLTT